MDELQKSDLLTQVISKEELRNEFLNAKQTLSWNLKFPTGNGGLTTEIIKLIKISHHFEDKRRITWESHW